IILGSVVIPPTRTLTVAFTGEGTGTVTISGSITCTSTSSYDFFAGTSLTLTATPSGSSIFVGWSGGGCSGTGPCQITLTENTTIYADFYVPPRRNYLIGWYRFNEGSGSIVYNHATDGSSGGGPLPNLTVVQNDGVFWSFLPGFGSTRDIFYGVGDGLVDFAWANPNRVLGSGGTSFSLGVFLRSKSSGYPVDAHGGLLSVWASHDGSGTADTRFDNDAIYGTLPVRRYVRIGYSHYLWWPGSAELAGRWHFYFVNNNGKFWAVRPEGDRVFLMNVDLNQTLNYRWMFAGVLYVNSSTNPTLGYSPGGGSYADWIIYNGTTLTDSEWAKWYDALRGRYGMAPRSGW
ncbi:MAG: hypothetical protein K6T87_15920, partial [Roseiflexus sp.]